MLAADGAAGLALDAADLAHAQVAARRVRVRACRVEAHAAEGEALVGSFPRVDGAARALEGEAIDPAPQRAQPITVVGARLTEERKEG